MQKPIKKRSKRDLLAKLGLGGLALALALCSPAAFAQQTQPNPDSSAPPAPDQQAAPPDQTANPPQDQGMPPNQEGPQDQAPPQDQAAPPPDQQNQQNQGPMNPPDNRNPDDRGARRNERVPPPLVPSNLTLPAGSVIQIRTTDFLSSDKNQKGNTFIATLAQPIVIDGWVVMRRGQTITGQVTDAVRAGRVKGVS